jgi:ABC-2 type transport system permease protein
MPVYEQGYRRYEARQPLRPLRFWPITREALRGLLAKKAFLLLLASAWLPALGFLVYLYVVTQFPEVGRQLPSDGRVFGRYLEAQQFFVLLSTVFAGAGLIAGDLRSGGILVYLSRPLTRRDYVLGKLGVLLCVQLFVTLVPGLLLYGAALALAPGHFARWELAWIGPGIVAQSLLTAFSFSLAALAVSSLVKSARAAGLLFFGGLMALGIVAGMLGAMSRRAEASLLSLPALLRTVGNALFGLSERGPRLPWSVALLALLLVGAGCLLILRARVRAVEVVR